MGWIQSENYNIDYSDYSLQSWGFWMTLIFSCYLSELRMQRPQTQSKRHVLHTQCKRMCSLSDTGELLTVSTSTCQSKQRWALRITQLRNDTTNVHLKIFPIFILDCLTQIASIRKDVEFYLHWVQRWLLFMSGCRAQASLFLVTLKVQFIQHNYITRFE